MNSIPSLIAAVPERSGARVASVVRQQVSELAVLGAGADLNDDASLIDDLGLDSLKFVDLSVGLERALGLAEFPMQDWVDSRLDAGLPLSVGGLIEACITVLQGGVVWPNR